MIGHELAIEQREAAGPQPRHQPRQRHLRCIRRAGEHALPKKGAAQRYAIKTTNKFVPVPAFDAVGMPHGIETVARLENRLVDPGVLAITHQFRAFAHHIDKSLIGRHPEPI
jgi:hypothetical protein